MSEWIEEFFATLITCFLLALKFPNLIFSCIVSENKNGFIHGYSDNYIRVKTLWASNLVDNINNVILDKIDNDNLVIARNI